MPQTPPPSNIPGKQVALQQQKFTNVLNNLKAQANKASQIQLEQARRGNFIAVIKDFRKDKWVLIYDDEAPINYKGAIQKKIFTAAIRALPIDLEHALNIKAELNKSTNSISLTTTTLLSWKANKDYALNTKVGPLDLGFLKDLEFIENDKANPKELSIKSVIYLSANHPINMNSYTSQRYSPKLGSNDRVFYSFQDKLGVVQFWKEGASPDLKYLKHNIFTDSLGESLVPTLSNERQAAEVKLILDTIIKNIMDKEMSPEVLAL